MFHKATKGNIKIRLGLAGTSGSGKTMTSLAIASYLSKKIAVIDTERGSAARYADLYDFDSCELEEFHPLKYIEAIQMAEKAGYEVIIIDSLSHAWLAELNIVNASKNKFAAWSPARELERKLIDAIVSCQAHVICTMRVKTVWDLSAKDQYGKVKPEKVGTAPVQASGIDYEFDVFGEINSQHVLKITKSRCPDLQDREFIKPGADVARILALWMQPLSVQSTMGDGTQVWRNWQSTTDAIAWAETMLPQYSKDQLIREFEAISPNSGKKAAAWVDWVRREV